MQLLPLLSVTSRSLNLLVFTCLTPFIVWICSLVLTPLTASFSLRLSVQNTAVLLLSKRAKVATHLPVCLDLTTTGTTDIAAILFPAPVKPHAVDASTGCSCFSSGFLSLCKTVG